MSTALRQILFYNQSTSTFRLVIIGTQFSALLKSLTNYSFPIPFFLNGTTQGLLVGTNKRVIRFTINENGELTQAIGGVAIDTITNGITIEEFGFLGIGIDQLQNNRLIIT